ncbi:hypothetical protein OGM63_10095 [Plectonema radiosum NIES-515]|uniref:Uncharacterized protein n=1 Tax=Plectonema radiosum NIES-515 TaxID=2986073 RepID=A0ABT3AXL6_9CYAN|nr:hypothetical protein [Plectonema radiosum]MCV3213858.1 hypothetical protein [Plectonema radiosum NIES-515]
MNTFFWESLGVLIPGYADIYTEPVQAVYEGGFPEPCLGRLLQSWSNRLIDLFALTSSNV